MKHTYYLLLIVVIAIINPLIAQNLPSSFDLRNNNNVNYVTSVKSQQGGTCWTHGAMSAMEGNLFMTGAWLAAGDTGEPNLAEYHLDWWNGFNDHNNDDAIPPAGSGLTVHFGGDYRVTAAYVTRAEGAVRDIDGQLYNTPPLRFDSSYHIYYPRHIEWFTAGISLERIDTIKKMIMNHGVLGTAMCVGGPYMVGDSMHYQPINDPSDPNHAISIIGWDDSIVTQAPLPGAWLCKNSWGSGWGLNGFFWISYYDKVCGHHDEMGTVLFRDVELFENDNVYYHDYHGWRDTDLNAQAVFNKFISNGTEVLKAVSFYTTTNNVNYEVIVYDDFINNHLSDTLSVVTGHFDYSGFHTVDINTQVSLSIGEDFYIYLKVSQGGYAFDRTSSVPVLLGADYRTTVVSAANLDESYFYTGTGWNDFYQVDTTANYCIKAITDFDITTSNINGSDIHSNNYSFFNYPNPFSNTTTLKFELSKSALVEVTILDVMGKEVKKIFNQKVQEGRYSLKWNADNYQNQKVAPGIYFSTMRINGRLVDIGRMVYLGN
ncbi:lectin like domain-containing protein [Bacteroidota bacterium]